ncbi:acyltransferase family protein [Granulicella sp. 5B5]|uniref:acyltransferase family protein n=1 Tax=Granulicella sp. 5B5 TaxID=1617967 RepID=UPI0015F46333|nr:acyltransferase [Granulicella sp. 5B5]QMV18413.1 acyltransferase family protein [Granulicella sp. 5B5]
MTIATAPTSTGEPAAVLQPAPFVRKPALPALTGLRTLLALTILLFHFTPSGLQWGPFSLYPIVDIGYVFVSFFFLISGFILSYNYADRPGGVNVADFWVARLSRLYPVYLLTMLISIPMLVVEWHARSHTEFWMGAIATPLLIQGFFPHLATFWNTVSWTLSCEIALYLMFPYLLRLKWPKNSWKLLALVIGFWAVGLIPHTIYVFTNPDHLPGPADRYSGGFWIDFLKYTPLPYLCTFLAGLTLGRLHEAAKLSARSRMIVGVAGFAAVWFTAYHLTDRLPYIMIHGGLLTPLFAAVILGLSGPSPLASVFSIRPLVTIGASTYCLYLLHFNVFILLHLHHVPEKLHVARFDPWISYVFVVLLALAVRKWVEHPCQIAIGNWWKRRRAAQAGR